MFPSIDDLKRQAAIHAVRYVEGGMRVGLGTGSTVKHFISELASRVRAGQLGPVIGVPTSLSSQTLAIDLGLRVEPLDHRPLDLAVDGADEVDPQLNLIKGLGGALLWEKLVGSRSREFIIVVDHGKEVKRLGQNSPLPIEIVPFGYQSTLERIASWGEVRLRMREDGKPYVTDGGNHLCDLRFHSQEVVLLADQLKSLTGVIETGFFLGMATRVVIASPQGILERSK